MNRENNVYTILYASIMVIIVAVALAFTHQSLSEQQTKNVNIDKMQQILRSLHINASTNEAESKYNELIKILIWLLLKEKKWKDRRVQKLQIRRLQQI
jgi:Na+-transporting NADH:ubiquinone oxidoreductase subunit C